MRKWIIVIALLIIGVVGYRYVYKGHRDIGSETPEFALTAKTIENEFRSNGITSEKKYLNKTIEISGNISNSNLEDITLNSVVFCQLTYSLKTPLKMGSEITIKGRVIGYDDLLEQVKLDQCILINY